VNVLQILGFSVLALVIVLLLPRYSLNVINTMAAQPVLAGGIGLLTMVLLPFVAVLLALLAITIILIPVTLIGFMVIAAALALGWIAVGYELGKLLETSLKQDWAEPVVAGIGTLMLGVGSWLVSMIPCIGWFLIVLVAAVGLGAVVLSRFGTQLNLPNPPAAPVTAITPVTPVPPPPPVPPAAPWIDPDPIVPAPPAAPSQPDDPQI
jgi:hypothetical protein